LKKIQEYQKHRKRQQKLNISDLESTFNSSDNNCYIYFRRKTKNRIISKIKTEQHDETYDLTSFMANPAAQMLKNFGKLPYYRKLTMHFINADFKNSR
jgi:hypothetical protein